ncbi:hypothetical protein O4214_05670 [Rhodococcus erythropolis]|uniref:hypothetical protein n=1 Tax=Rhodococcus erythropolis TaxID=1833 RepID=UPI001E49B60C|nr:MULTISPECIES: hypothetical protein [Rhodococcus erythropolis group]MCD2104406.1 hypothetical protein [Rhodococcus qingshengii]MCZ4523461.1 hypothetical protein [Rhodococcus erythropolis]
MILASVGEINGANQAAAQRLRLHLGDTWLNHSRCFAKAGIGRRSGGLAVGPVRAPSAWLVVETLTSTWLSGEPGGVLALTQVLGNRTLNARHIAITCQAVITAPADETRVGHRPGPDGPSERRGGLAGGY